MSPEQRRRRVDRYVEALRVQEADERRVRVMIENVTTAEIAGAEMALAHGGSYDAERTLAYWDEATDDVEVAEGDDVEAIALGLFAVAFARGTVEYAHQDPREWRKLYVWSQNPNGRPEHEALDGMVIPLDEEWPTPAPGGPGCGCSVEILPPE